LLYNISYKDFIVARRSKNRIEKKRDMGERERHKS